MRNIVRISVLSVLVCVLSQPLAAQRGGGGGGGNRGAPPTTRDTIPVRTTPDGTFMDFNNQDVTQVLRAIAEAGNLQVVFTSMPRVNVTLRIQMKMTPEEAKLTLKSVAEINNIKVTEGPTIITLVGPPPPPPTAPPVNAQTAALLAMQNRVLTVNVIRLKHQTASSLAPVLMALFTGTGTGAGGINNTNIGGRGVNLGGGAVGGGGAAGGGGRGGRGGGGAGGAAGGGGRGAGGAGNIGGINLGGLGGGAGGFGAALQNAFGVGGLGLIRPFQDMRIVAEQTTNSLLVFSTAEDFATVQQLVTGVDIRPLQVLVEVTIAQVQRTHDLDVGISGTSTKGRNVTSTSGTGVKTTTTVTDTTALLPSAAGAKDFIAQLTGGHGMINYNVALNALQTRGEVRVLSLPVIIAQNNIQAVISVGSQVPFVSVSQTVPNDPTGRVQTIQYQNVGTTLTILPTINPDGYVNLTVDQTNNDVTNNLLFDAPIINNREATTQILIKDGQTTVIGGLADNTTDNTTSGIPILSRIPIIGSWLFGNTTKHKDATELYLFLTPHVISSDEDIDRLRNSLKGSSELLKDVPMHALDPAKGDTIFIGSPPAKKPPPDAPPAKKPPPTAADSGSSSTGDLPLVSRREQPIG